MITADDIKQVAPEFCALTSAEIQPFIDDSMLFVKESCFGTFTDMAIKYLTAHMLSMSRRGSVGGSVASKSVGSMSVSYSTMNDGSAFNSTAYGQMYQKLRKSRVLTMKVIC